MTPELTPADLDALIEKLRGLDRDDACLKGTQMVPLHRDTLREIAAALDVLKKQNDEQEYLMTLASAHRDELEAQIAALRADAERKDAALDKAREDINWMLNNRRFLNTDVFDYIDAAREAKP